MNKRVVTQGGGQNLFKIEGTKTLYVYQIEVGNIFDKKRNIGTAQNLEDALSIIRSYSGNEIKEIKG